MGELVDILCVEPSGGGFPSKMQGAIVRCSLSHSHQFYTICESPGYPPAKGLLISQDWIDNGDFRILENEEQTLEDDNEFKAGDTVVVIGAAKDTYWYADYIGEDFVLDKNIGYGTWLVKDMGGCYIMEEDFVLKEYEEEDDEPRYTVIFNPEQIHEAAMMVSELNTISSLTVNQVEDRIYDIIKAEVRKGLRKAKTIATVGFIIHLADAGDEKTVVAEVSVDPSVGKYTQFISGSLDSKGNLVAQYPNR